MLRSAMDEQRPILGLDTASPIVSVAVGTAHVLLAERTLELRSSSELLLRTIEAALEQAGCGFDDLAGCAVLRGPGSFTGLRVGLGTALGFHQATGLPLAVLPSLHVLASSLSGRPDSLPGTASGEIVAAVDALRGEWLVQRFASPGEEPQAPPRPLREPELLPGASLGALAPCRLVGFGVGALAGALGPACVAIEPEPLAPWAVRLAANPTTSWDAALAVQPIYFRPAAVTVAVSGPRLERGR